ncbi:PGPGW domain-containing protein [Knoellia sp. S7-12]|uniref:PGPGW domain-containing protein n=1 Tax=Knoellia sp. S7-12 TaxID=3126698 RepID=UPI00338FB78F
MTWQVALLAAGLGLVALGLALIPLPGPGYFFVSLGAIITAVAAVLTSSARTSRR